MFRPIFQKLLRALDFFAPQRDDRPKHLVTGARGEEFAHFYLRDQGYTIVARNWRVGQAKGELDLIGWEGNTLCFVEVKTRTSHDVKPAEAAVDEEKRRQLRQMARRYMRRLKPVNGARTNEGDRSTGNIRLRRANAQDMRTKCRFDILSLYLSPSGAPEEVTLFRNAFPLA